MNYRIISLIVATPLVLSGCAIDQSSESTPSDESSSAVTESANPSGTDCIPVSESLITAINQGVIGVDPNNNLTNAFAVLAPEREKVWFIAAEISGPGIESKEAIGVWATNRGPDNSNSGLIFSVDSFAKTFSDWGEGGSDIGLNQSEKGVQEAIDCVLENG